MFDLAKEAYNAKTADKIGMIYHRGQDRAWNGKEVLAMLVEEHGVPDLPQEKKEALSRIFAIILWGELAAWKISAQLADEMAPLEAKMAATSQAHDEARHFYVMYDYLTLLDYVPDRIDPRSERVLKMTLGADSLAHKMCGMQLMIETIALTIFQTVRQNNIEPVLSGLLRYFEIDEARHIGLGVNYMPTFIRKMSRFEIAEMTLFQLRIMLGTLISMMAITPDLVKLGIHPREIINLGKAKQYEVFRELWGELGVDLSRQRTLLERFFDSFDELFFPQDLETGNLERVKKAFKRFTSSQTEVDPDLLQEAVDQLQDDIVLEGMGHAGAKWQGRMAKRHRARTAKAGATH
jgi:hypothetical protein